MYSFTNKNTTTTNTNDAQQHKPLTTTNPTTTLLNWRTHLHRRTIVAILAALTAIHCGGCHRLTAAVALRSNHHQQLQHLSSWVVHGPTAAITSDGQARRAQSLLAATTTLPTAGAAAITTTTTTQQPFEVPDFNEPIGNHTVALGRDAQLSCKINNLGQFRTAWLRVEDKGILTIHNNIITRNYRIGLINNDDGKNFILTIKNVQPSDKGGYMCQINSVPMKYAIGYLDVLTPPAFDDAPPPAPSSSNLDGDPDSATATTASPAVTTTLTPAATAAGLVVVNEGNNASLSCRANGHPSPVITWRREDNEPILLNGGAIGLDAEAGVSRVEGPTISLQSVSRLNSGAYLCIASNGVQPSASKRQVLDVQYRPVVRLPQTELGAHLNQAEARLVCFVELNPLGSYHWVKLADGATAGQPAQQRGAPESGGREQYDDMSLIEHDALMNSDKYEIVMKALSNEKVQLILNVRRVERADFGWYKCIARNSLGIQSNSIRLYESSSFSLNNMFRGGDPQPTATESPDSQQQHPQNDQQQQEPAAPGSSGRPVHKASSILSRAHTRSSWVQRSSSGRQQEANGANDQAVSSSSASPRWPVRRGQAAGASLVPSLLLSYCHQLTLLLLLNCFLLLVSSSVSAQSIVVVVNL